MTPILFSQINSVRYNTAPLYSNVRTAAMFGLSSSGAFPLSRHDSKAMYRECIPTAPHNPHMNAPLRGQGPPWAGLSLGARRWGDRRGTLALHADGLTVPTASVPFLLAVPFVSGPQAQMLQTTLG